MRGSSPLVHAVVLCKVTKLVNFVTVMFRVTRWHVHYSVSKNFIQSSKSFKLSMILGMAFNNSKQTVDQIKAFSFDLAGASTPSVCTACSAGTYSSIQGCFTFLLCRTSLWAQIKWVQYNTWICTSISRFRVLCLVATSSLAVMMDEHFRSFEQSSMYVLPNCCLLKWHWWDHRPIKRHCSLHHKPTFPVPSTLDWSRRFLKSSMLISFDSPFENGFPGSTTLATCTECIPGSYSTGSGEIYNCICNFMKVWKALTIAVAGLVSSASCTLCLAGTFSSAAGVYCRIFGQ